MFNYVLANELLIQQNRTRRSFADELGLKMSTLKHYLCGASRPGTETVKRMAKLLHCDHAKLLLTPHHFHEKKPRKPRSPCHSK